MPTLEAGARLEDIGEPMVRCREDRGHPRQRVLVRVIHVVVRLQDFVAQADGFSGARREPCIDFGVGIDDDDAVVVADGQLRDGPGNRLWLAGVSRGRAHETRDSSVPGNVGGAIGAVVSNDDDVHPAARIAHSLQRLEACRQEQLLVVCGHQEQEPWQFVRSRAGRR